MNAVSRYDRRLQEGDRAGEQDQRERQRGAKQHDASLGIELDAEAGVQPAQQPGQLDRAAADCANASAQPCLRAANLTLLGLNMRDGLKLTGRLRRQPR